jgi:hypothetical protein
MLERVPATRILIRNPKNKKMKRFIDASVAINAPLLERIMAGKSQLDDITMLIHSMFSRELEFAAIPPKNLLSFGREAALGWDSVSMKKRKGLGLDPELCKQISPASNYFSNMHRGNSSLGILLDRAEKNKGMLKRFRLLLGLQAGDVPFEEVKKYFLDEAKECLELSSFQTSEKGIMLVGMRVKKDPKTKKLEYIPGELRLSHTRIYATMAGFEEKFAKSKNEVASRLIVGYSPVI